MGDAERAGPHAELVLPGLMGSVGSLARTFGARVDGPTPRGITECRPDLQTVLAVISAAR